MALGYFSAIDFAAEISPTLDKPTEFIKWAEGICEVISHIYGVNYEEVTNSLIRAVKSAQGIEDEEDDTE